MLDSFAKSFVEISQVLIHFQGRYLMQLRDFKEEIESPGKWGLFGGHTEPGESPEQTIWREIKEELCWQPSKFDVLGDIILGNRRMHVFYCELNENIENLNLQEGDDIGIFFPNEINKKKLFSYKNYSYFPIAEISFKVFKKFS